MIVWATCLLVLASCQLSRGFNIDIHQCHTARGAVGFCRHHAECVGFYEQLQPDRCPPNFVCCPHRSISERKCHEYAQAVFSRHSGAANFLPHSQNGHFGGDDECNIQGIPLIIGGEQAQPKEFPHMAAIAHGVDPYEAKWGCGGSLISENFVVTAAHCVRLGLPLMVKFGTTDVFHDFNDNVQIQMVDSFIHHPLYDDRSFNDIALLKLSRPVVFTPFVRPLCLDFSGQPSESKALATGWGRTTNANHNMNRFLLKVLLDIVDRGTCQEAFKYRLRTGMTDALMCYGVLAGGKDTCPGDSGGPLVTIRKEPYCMYTLVGVTQGGFPDCGIPHAPALYTRVFSHLPWIESIVWPNEG